MMERVAKPNSSCRGLSCHFNSQVMGGTAPITHHTGENSVGSLVRRAKSSGNCSSPAVGSRKRKVEPWFSRHTTCISDSTLDTCQSFWSMMRTCTLDLFTKSTAVYGINMYLRLLISYRYFTSIFCHSAPLPCSNVPSPLPMKRNLKWRTGCAVKNLCENFWNWELYWKTFGTQSLYLQARISFKRIQTSVSVRQFLKFHMLFTYIIYIMYIYMIWDLICIYIHVCIYRYIDMYIQTCL